jgi:exopolysaccharide biosynthesis operon protein EpsL
MRTSWLIALSMFMALRGPAFSQQLEEYTPLQKERWLQESQPLQLKLYGGLSYDSNLFRLSDEADAQAAIGSSDKSDMIYQLGAGAQYEIRKSRQKFIAQANFTEYRFQRFDNLNNTSNALLGEWQWQVGNDWNGDLGFAHRRYLESFAEFQQNLRDMVNHDRLYGSANYFVYSRLKLTLAADWNDTDHGEPSRDSLDSKINNTILTVNWVTPAENTVGAQFRNAKARYPNSALVGTSLVENDYTEREYSAVTYWRITGASELRARLGHTERTFDQAPNRDYSAPTWRLNYIWRPTGKTAVDFSTWRELSDFQNLSANYVRVTGISIIPTWSLAPKLALRGKILHETLDYLGDPGLTAPTSQREDKDKIYQVSLLWTPLRLTEMDFNLETGRRTSNQALADFKYNAISFLLTRYF